VVICSLQYQQDIPSGANRLALDEAVYLAKAGHEVWLAVAALDRRFLDFSNENGVHVVRYHYPQYRPWDIRRIMAHQNSASAILSRYVPDDVDIIHGHTLLSYAGALKYYGNKGTKGCYSVHSPVKQELLAARAEGQYFRNRLQSIRAIMANRIERHCIESSAAVTVFSNYTWELLKKARAVIADKNISIIPGWVSLDKYRICNDREKLKVQLNWPTDGPVFFTLRRLVKRMGIDQLLYAMKRLESAGRRSYLFIGGAGPLRSQLEMLSVRLGLSHRVFFLGQVPEDALPLMYAAADAFVLPTSTMECFGLIALEALACGRPVLATPVGAIPEIMNGIEPSWLATNASAAAITDLLANFMKGALPSHEPSALRETVAASYSKDTILEKIQDLLIGLATH